MSIEDVKRKYEEQLMRLPNVVGVGIGEKKGKAVIKVFVTHKVPVSELQPQEVVPNTLEGYDTLEEYETDVEEKGGVTAQLQLQSEEPYKILFDYVYSPKRYLLLQDRLLLAPEEVVRDAAQKLNLTLNGEELAFIAAALIEAGRIATAQGVIQKQRAEQRINQSIQAMRNAFRLMLVMHNVMFYLGVALIVISVISAFNGRAVAGIVLGGVGLVDLIFFLIKEPIEGIHESTGNLMQLRAAYNSYFVQLEQWQLYYDYQSGKDYIEIKRQVADQIHQYTEATLDLIQQYCKPTSEWKKGKEVQSHGT